MVITDIHLQNFRSYRDDSFEFSPEVNIIVGPNGSGKTNLLEALLYVSSGRSYRAKDQELIKIGAEWSKLDTFVEDSRRVVKLEEFNGVIRRSFEIDGNTHKRRLPFVNTIPVVLFEPNNLLILSGSPELRRNYLDDLLEQTIFDFKDTNAKYKRTLIQRNALLKSGLAQAEKQIFTWNVRLSELGAQIVRHRLEIVELFNERVGKIYKKISKKDDQVEFRYLTKISPRNYVSDLFNQLEKNLEVDCYNGFTSAGPHRDDLEILFNNRVSSRVVSRGETRTILLVLKILEAEILNNNRDVKPVFLLDDVFSELDGSRRRALTDYLKTYQTFITTTDADVVIKHFTNTNIIPLKN